MWQIKKIKLVYLFPKTAYSRPKINLLMSQNIGAGKSDNKNIRGRDPRGAMKRTYQKPKKLGIQETILKVKQE
jgi:hypothetical protein